MVYLVLIFIVQDLKRLPGLYAINALTNI
jgi:hypothetical protein